MTVQSDTDDGVKVFLPPEPINPAFKENAVPVFLGCDDRFFAPAMTVVASIMEHAGADAKYDLFIVQNDIPRPRLRTAVEWMRRFPNASLRFVDGWPIIESHANSLTPGTVPSHAAFFRFFAPRIFAHYDRIVYIDSDVVLFHDIADLYHHDLKGSPIGACHDFVAERQSLINREVASFWQERLHITPGTGYFNSGVLVMDLTAMRERNFTEALLERAKRIGRTNLADQDVLNSVLGGDFSPIDCGWNFFDWMLDPDERAAQFAYLSDDDRALVDDARRDVKLVHFTERKPWRRDYMGKNADLYWRYARKTPFYHESLENLRRECGGWSLAVQHMKMTAQGANYRLRSLFCGEDKKERYQARLANLTLLKRGLRRQSRLARGESPAPRS
ncbi:MAG: glycosyltransferase family 8 protein [Planctomycetaceae bacterium]|nr:glycosyltransferase family 8 protein [Planctomycetaceae bacterium]